MIKSFTLLACLALTSCSAWVFDNFDSCPRGILVEVYAQTECETTPCYPSEVTDLTLMAFDEAGTLVAARRDTNVRLKEGEQWRLEVPSEGAYKVVAWSGVSAELFDTPAIKIGETKLSDLYARLRREVVIGGRRVWQGATERDAVVGPLKDGQTEQYVSAAVNLRELTNRITVRITGLANPADVELEVRSSNAEYLQSGSILREGMSYTYPLSIERTENTYDPTQTPPAGIHAYNGKLTALFTTLRLETGRKSLLTLTSKATGGILYRGDLVALLLSAEELSTGAVNLRCQNDFEVNIKVRRCPTCSDGYQVVQIFIDDWCVHSIDVDLK